MASKNGQGPQVRRREVWVEMPGEYEGFKALVWVNAPTKLWLGLQDQDVTEEERMTAASSLVLEHNGWRDFDGKVYPQPSEAAFWEEIPTELAAVLLAAIQLEAKALPNSMMGRKRR